MSASEHRPASTAELDHSYFASAVDRQTRQTEYHHRRFCEKSAVQAEGVTAATRGGGGACEGRGDEDDDVVDPPLFVDSAEHSMAASSCDDNCGMGASAAEDFVAVNQRLSEDSEHLDFIRSIAEEAAAAVAQSSGAAGEEVKMK